MSYQSIPLDALATTFGQTTGERAACPRPPFRSLAFIWLELSSVALGGEIVDVSDDLFCAASHLLLVEVSFFPIGPPWLSSPILPRPTRIPIDGRPHIARIEPERSIRTKRRLVQWVGVEEAQPDIRLVRRRFVSFASRLD
jgi:hypothetical protein